jgi:hypothetical protein
MGGLLQRAACCAFCRTAGGHHDEQRGRGLAAGISGRPWELGGHGSRIGSCMAGKNRGARGISCSVHCRGWSSRLWEGRWQGGRWRTGKGAMAVGGACSKGVEVGYGCWRPSEQSERRKKGAASSCHGRELLLAMLHGHRVGEAERRETREEGAIAGSLAARASPAPWIQGDLVCPARSGARRGSRVKQGQRWGRKGGRHRRSSANWAPWKEYRGAARQEEEGERGGEEGCWWRLEK